MQPSNLPIPPNPSVQRSILLFSTSAFQFYPVTHFPARQSDPMAFSGDSRRKKSPVSASKLFSMTVGIMQPYFFPYLGYFSLMAATDEWIFFDTPQYIRHGWVNRNRILKPSKDDWQYIIAPLEKHERNCAIRDVRLMQNGWQQKMLAQLHHYKKGARYYNDVITLVKSVLEDSLGLISLAKLNELSVKVVCDYCAIPISNYTFSEMNLAVEKAEAPDEWALEITKAVGAKCYVNPTGGMNFFNKSKYSSAGIELKFLRNTLQSYPQPNALFIPGLSVIDALMYCSPEHVRQLIYSYEWVEAEASENISEHTNDV